MSRSELFDVFDFEPTREVKKDSQRHQRTASKKMIQMAMDGEYDELEEYLEHTAK